MARRDPDIGGDTGASPRPASTEPGLAPGSLHLAGHGAGHAAELPPICRPDRRRWILLAAILGSALGFIDGSIVAIALPAIRAELSATLAQAQWINNAYVLPLSALILLGGALGDRYGLVRMFSAGLAIFLAASVLCTLAPSPDWLIAGRLMKGLGGAVMVPGSLALIARAYPEEERGRAIGLWAAASALTTALGPIIGGVALSFGPDWAWRALFALNLPIGAFALWALRAHADRDAGLPDRPLDGVGAGLITLALALMALGLTTGEEQVNATLAAAGLVPFAAFLWWEARIPHPMVPLSLFRNRGFASANAATFLVYGALTTMLFYLPMTLIAGWGVAEAAAALVFAPLSASIALLSARAGGWADRHGPGRLIGGGGAVLSVGCVVLARGVDAQSIVTGVLPATFIMGIGMGLVAAPLSSAIMASVGPARAGTASGVNNAVARMAGLISVAAMGGLAASVYAGAGGPESFGAFSANAATAAHGTAMTLAFATLAWVTAALTALGAALAWAFIPPPPQSRDVSARR